MKTYSLTTLAFVAALLCAMIGWGFGVLVCALGFAVGYGKIVKARALKSNAARRLPR